MNSDTLEKQIGKKIKLFRTIKGWSRQQAADLLEVSLTAYGSIERGETNISIARLEKIAKIFEIALTDLLGSTEKNVFNFAQENNRKCNNWQVASLPDSELNLKHELEKSQLIQQAQAEKIENLEQQILQLKEIIALMKMTPN